MSKRRRNKGLPRPLQKGVLSRLLRESAGNALPLAGAALVPICAMIGSGLDMSRAYMAQAKLQNACDAAALAARRHMAGTNWTDDVRTEGERFFHFNFPNDTMNSQDIQLAVTQSEQDRSTVEVRASADVPTTVMGLFGKEFIPIAAECDADQDYGNNDIMVVMDVTGSMNSCPGGGNCNGNSNSKIARLRAGAIGLYRALDGVTNTRTRYGFMPYAVTVNVGRDLNLSWIRNPAEYQRCVDWDDGYCDDYDLVSVDHNADWFDDWRGNGSYTTNMGRGCVEERATIGQSGSPIEIHTSVSQDDIDLVSTSTPARQWAPYDPNAVQGEYGSTCPRPARRLAEYSSETAYQTQIDRATSSVGGNTYHDIGIIWAARFLSSTGMFSSDNPTEWLGVPVAKHIVFLTDGIMQPSSSVYSAYGVDYLDDRVAGSGGLTYRHVQRFQATCNRAKQMGMTIWVIALDVADTSNIQPCATSSGHFFVSDGTDLEDVFTRIGQGIGRLRLTQ